MEEEKAVVDEGATVSELQKKKALQERKPMSANDEGAFNLYIYRVLKEHAPEFSVSKKAMRTLNSINTEKFS